MVRLDKIIFKGSSIIEVIVSMIIIAIIFGISLIIFGNLSTGNHNLAKTKLNHELQKRAEETIEKELFFDEEWKEGDYTIKKEISPLREFENVYKLSLLAKGRSGKIIESYSTIIIIE